MNGQLRVPSRILLFVTSLLIGSAVVEAIGASVRAIALADGVIAAIALPRDERVSLRAPCVPQTRSYSIELHVIARIWFDRKIATNRIREIVTCDPSGDAVVTRTVDGRIAERTSLALASGADKDNLSTELAVQVFEGQRLNPGTRYRLRVRRMVEGARTREAVAVLAETTFIATP